MLLLKLVRGKQISYKTKYLTLHLTCQQIYREHLGEMGSESKEKLSCRCPVKSDNREETFFPGKDFEFSLFHEKQCLKKVNLGVKVVEIWEREIEFKA